MVLDSNDAAMRMQDSKFSMQGRQTHDDLDDKLAVQL